MVPVKIVTWDFPQVMGRTGFGMRRVLKTPLLSTLTLKYY